MFKNVDKKLFDLVGSIVVIIDKNQKVTLVNKKGCELLGYTFKDIVGKNWFDNFVPYKERESVKQFFQMIVAGTVKDEESFKNSVLTKSGEERIVFWRNTSILDDDGNFNFSLSSGEDVTDKKGAILALKDSESKYKALVKTLDSIIVCFDAEGAILYINDYGIKLLGCGENDLVGKNIFETVIFLSNAVNSKENKLNDFFLYPKKYKYFEKDYIDCEGKPLWVAWRNKVIINPQTGEKEILSVGNDITNRKTAEAEIIRTKNDSEEAVILKDKFVSLVAHDLKSPISSISGLLEFMLDDSIEPLSLKQRKFIQSILTSVKKMNLFICDVLSVNKITKGKMKLRPKYVNVFSIVDKIVVDHKMFSNKKSVKLINQVNADICTFVDPVLFSHVLENLINNAIKFSRSDGTVIVFSYGETEYAIAIRDTGMGIKKNILSNIFDYDKSTSTPGTLGEVGTGLGLPISREIMLAHGANIEVETEFNVGSTFRVTLPSWKPLVLIVDDEEIFRIKHKSYLYKIGAEVIEAKNGKEALNLIMEKSPSLVISDVRMPVMDGFELLENVKNNPLLKSVNFIIVTCIKLSGIAEKAFNLGADDFIKKPFDENELISRARRLIEQ